jgi:hypothetical protein
MVSIVIPTHAYLKKYAFHLANSRGVIQISSADNWGILLLKILQKKASWEPNEKLKFEDEITFGITEFFYSKTGFFISKQNINFFNNSLQSQFEEALFVQATINLTGSFKTTIEEQIQSYLCFYNITENEKSLDSLLKAYQRWRKEHNYKLIRA